MTAPGSGPVLVTERLRLVPLAEEDVARVHVLLIDPGVRRHLMDDEIVERPWVVDLVESSRRTFADAKLGLWRIESKRDGAFVGFAGLRTTLGAREPQLIYALDPAFWGQGLATEAAAAVADYAFDELAFEDLLASTDPPNQASIRVMERLGMRFLEASCGTGGYQLLAGPASRRAPADGRPLAARPPDGRAPRSGGHPLVFYRMTRAEWERSRGRVRGRATASVAAAGQPGPS